jgi:hypothetical protein
MQLGGDALRFVLAQGLPAVIEVTGRSMEPTIALGTKVDVVGLGPGDVPRAGDVALFATADPQVRLLHRVLLVFDEGGRTFVVHQGDTPGSSFGISERADVLARMTTPPAPAGAVEELRLRRRRLAAAAYVRARGLSRALGVADSPLVRRCAQVFRKLARAVTR